MSPNENPAPHHETPAFGDPDLPQEGMVNTTGDPAGTKMADRETRCWKASSRT